MGTLLQTATLFTFRSLEDLYNETRATINSMRSWAILTLLLPLLIIACGIGISAVAWSDTVLAIGYGVKILGVFTGVALVLYFAARCEIYGFIILGTIDLLAKTTPAADPHCAEAKSRIAAMTHKVGGFVAWVAMISLYVTFVDVHESLGIFAGVLLAAVGLAATGVALWTTSTLPRYILIGGFVAVIVVGTALLANKTARIYAGSLKSGVSLDSGTAEERALAKELDAKLAQQLHAIRTKMVRECGGEYCNEGDRKAAEALTEDRLALKAGRYFDNAGVKGERASKSAAKAKATSQDEAETETAEEEADDESEGNDNRSVTETAESAVAATGNVIRNAVEAVTTAPSKPVYESVPGQKGRYRKIDYSKLDAAFANNQ